MIKGRGGAPGNSEEGAAARSKAHAPLPPPGAAQKRAPGEPGTQPRRPPLAPLPLVSRSAPKHPRPRPRAYVNAMQTRTQTPSTGNGRILSARAQSSSASDIQRPSTAVRSAPRPRPRPRLPHPNLGRQRNRGVRDPPHPHPGLPPSPSFISRTKACCCVSTSMTARCVCTAPNFLGASMRRSMMYDHAPSASCSTCGKSTEVWNGGRRNPKSQF
jgi:hypothetical protein